MRGWTVCNIPVSGSTDSVARGPTAGANLLPSQIPHKYRVMRAEGGATWCGQMFTRSRTCVVVCAPFGGDKLHELLHEPKWGPPAWGRPLRESQLKTIMLGQPTALDIGKALRAVARASNYNKKLFARAPVRARQAQSRAQRLVVSEQAAKSQEKEAAAEQREEHRRQRDAAVSELMSTLHAQMTIIGMRADVGLPRAEAAEVGSQLAAIRHCIQQYHQRLEQGIVDHDKSARVLMQRSLEREVRIERMIGEEATASAGSLLAQEVMRAKVAGRVAMCATS